MIYLFCDTNFFMQAKFYQELKLCEHFKKDITVVIPYVVMTEIDKLKSDSNQKKQKRAKQYNTIFDTLLCADCIENKENNYTLKILVNINDNVSPNKSNDDNLIDEYLSYKRKNSSQDVRLVSYDRGILFQAKNKSINYFKIPDEWLSKSESDPKDIKIKNLEQEIKKMQDQMPNIIIDIEPAKTNIIINEYVPLSSSEIDDYLNRIEEVKNNKQNNDLEHGNVIQSENRYFRRFNDAFIADLVEIPLNENSLINYQQKCADWRVNTREYLSNLHEIIKNMSTYHDFVINIKNDGGAPANDVELIIETSADLFFLENENNKDDVVKYVGIIPINIPPYPKHPANKNIAPRVTPSLELENLTLYKTFDYLNKKIKYSRGGFEFIESRPERTAKKWELSKETLRHKQDSKKIPVTLLIPEGFGKKNIYLKVKCSAANIIEPIEIYPKIKPDYRKVSLTELIKRRVKE